MAAGTRGEGGDDGLVVAAIVLAAVVLLAMVFAKPLQGAVWMVLRTEADAVALVSPLLTDESRQRLDRWVQRLHQPPPARATPDVAVAALTIGGRWLRWPLLALFSGLGLWLILRSPTFRYTRTLDFESLLLEQARTFVRVRPTLWLKGRMSAAERGNYQRAQSPYEWAQACGAITPRPAPADTEATWNADSAAGAFAAQLGVALPVSSADRFATTCSAMAYHERLLFAAFAARVMDRKKDSDDLLDGIAIGFGPAWSTLQRAIQRLRGRTYDWPANGPWMIRLTSTERRLVESIIVAAGQSKEIQSFVAAHAHTRVLLAAMLERAQAMHGILTTSDFRWVKAVDRTLHFTLNDVGRRVASSEASGIRAHQLAERAAGHRLTAPDVAAAVHALRIHLDESSWQPPPLVDVTKFTVEAAAAVANLSKAIADADTATQLALEAGQAETTSAAD